MPEWVDEDDRSYMVVDDDPFEARIELIDFKDMGWIPMGTEWLMGWLELDGCKFAGREEGKRFVESRIETWGTKGE